MTRYDLIDNIFSEERVEDAVRELFSENGTVYLVAGYFSRSGYHQMEESMKDFLERNAKNKIVVIIGTEPNQFSATIAYELWQMDEEKPGSVELLKFNDTFLHTKHYVRKNDAPAVILGSANFTGEGFGKHLELVSYYETSESDDSVANQHIAWFEDLIPECSQVTEEDLEEYRKKRIEIETIEDDEILEELGVSLSELREKLEDPDSFGSYRVNLLSRYLEVEDTSRATIAVKSRIEKYPHQIIGGSQAYRNLSYNGFYLLADEVGLGKTYEAGLALKQLKFAGKVDRALVVCNSSAMRDWEEALEKFYEDPTLITSS
ncbi:MAG: restriction endonuclease PLD domain-containing protein, partial [Candidatus Aenigmatarchaeota archaeon]